MEQFDGKVFRADAYLPADYTEQNQRQDYSPIQPGMYHAVVADIDYRRTKRGDGTLISVRYEIKSEPATGRTIYHNFNMSNPNKDAATRGRKDFSKCCKALGCNQLSNVDELMGLECKIKIEADFRNADDRRVTEWYTFDGEAEAIAETPF